MNGALALGLMSGTSADGVSAALGRFQGHSFEFLGDLTVDYPENILLKIRQRGALPASQVSLLNRELGELFAAAALKLLKKTHTKPESVECIGSHGQTIYHGPQDELKNTLQLADPAVIAERTGIPVVSNFRQRDIAVGGEGAPLIPFFDHFFFGSGPVRALLNIGGIANVTIVGRGLEGPLAFDTGPGNCLMDLVVQEITQGKEPFDRGGARAKHGTIDMAVVGRMLEHPYFKKPPPKSTGPEMFDHRFLMEYLGEKIRINPEDALATLNYFTCLTIQESFRNHVFKDYSVTELIVSGGGVHNKVLMKKMECLFAPIPVKSIESTGLPAQAKEPLAFAFFGLRGLHHQINHLPSGTGAKQARVLGSITKP
ncbi:MAG: Anhydro-N-acetylmuramic acid kinase [Elusimicrobia bacterium]|nr:Anhydro-N-acetylmuramic acid kinase [Elusimicrobiota bacterium]